MYPAKGLPSTWEYPRVNHGKPVKIQERTHSTSVKIAATKRGWFLNFGKTERDRKKRDRNKHKIKVESIAKISGIPPNFWRQIYIQ